MVLGARLVPTAWPQGVYCICTKQPSAFSDIVYFGKVTNARGLRGRLTQYFHPGHLQRTNLRIQQIVKLAPGDFEVAWTSCEAEEARRLEARLIGEFVTAHGQLPPWNRSRPLG